MNKKTFFITTPIYYPSGKLHIGHVYTTTLANTLANYKKAMGYEVKFLTGTDEHGQKIQEKAKENNMSYQEYVDNMSESFKDLWKKMDIKYDFYSRTTNSFHKKAVATQFSMLYKKGDIYKGFYKGLYSISDEEFLTKTQAVEKDGKFYHPTSGHELKEVKEESYFLKLSKYENWWKEYVTKNPNFIRPPKIVKELKNNFVDKGLADLSITRSTFDWGIKINEDPKHVIYVWMDALNNYITALGYNSDDESNFDKFWKNGDEIIHIVGKEITRFHGIYWPIILKAAGIKLPTAILSHGWIITLEGKMSKSKGNVVDPIYLINKYGNEVVKYFFAAKIKMSQDGIFDENILKNVYNSELANNYGNLFSRTIGMILQNFELPIKHKKTNNKLDKDLLENIINKTELFKKHLNDYNISNGYDELIELGKKLNGYIDLTKPWNLKEDKERLSQILNNLLNGIYAIYTMLSLVMPKKVALALKALGFKQASFELIKDFEKFNNHLPKKNEILFERIK